MIPRNENQARPTFPAVHKIRIRIDASKNARRTNEVCFKFWFIVSPNFYTFLSRIYVQVPSEKSLSARFSYQKADKLAWPHKQSVFDNPFDDSFDISNLLDENSPPVDVTEYNNDGKPGYGDGGEDIYEFDDLGVNVDFNGRSVDGKGPDILDDSSDQQGLVGNGYTDYCIHDDSGEWSDGGLDDYV